MATIATPFSTQHIDFEVDYHKTMAAILAACKAVKNHAWTLLLAKDIWGVSRDFKELLVLFDRNLHGISVEEIRYILPKLQHLNTTSNRVIDTATKAGLKNRMFTAASLMSFVTYNDQLKDVIERLALSLDPTVEESVREAIAEYNRGETVSLDSLV
jgi:hypothetical protein